MIEMAIVWVLLPLLLVLLCYGFGLVFTLIARRPAHFTITTVIGFLLMAVLGSLTTISTATAPYTAIAFGLISLGGLVVSAIWFRSHLRFDGLPTVAGIFTYIAFGLPTFAYGHPSWAGWIKLDDDSSFLAVTDRLMNVGRTVPFPVSSTFDRLIQTFFASEANGHFSYPVGTFIPFGVVTKLTGVEKAWFFQPYLAFSAALVAMLFVLLIRTRVSNRALVFVTATVSAMASTIYSYVMWGGVKEIVIIIPVVLLAFSLFHAIEYQDAREYFYYSAIAFFGIIVVGGTAGVGYAAPIFFAAVLTILWERNKQYFKYFLGATVVIAGVLILLLKSGNKSITNLFIPIIGDTGNLSKSLNIGQVFGIWPSSDFRLDPVNKPITFLLIAIAFLFTIAGIYFSIIKLNWVIPSLVLSCTAVVATSYAWGGIWITGKAIAVASPIFLLSAFVGAHELWLEVGQEKWKRFATYRLHVFIVSLTVLVAAGVVTSDIYTYKNVWLAPYSQQDELRNIGSMFAGEGSALMTEYSVYGSRYFLRDLEAEAASELRVHVIPTRDGKQVPRGFAADIDLFEPATIDYYNLLVLRKSPNGSRPPLDYNLAWSGEYYQVWKKVKGVRVRKTLPLGTIFYPGAVPTCSAVTSFLADRSKSEKIYMAVRNPVYVVDFTAGELPANWQPMASYTGGVHFAGPGAFNRNFSVAATGKYSMWIAGSYPGRLRVLVDGTQVYSGHSVFESNLYLTNPLSGLDLSAGSHVLTLIYDSPRLMSGSDSASEFGPIYLANQTAGDVRVKPVSISRIPELCKLNLDWIALAN
ncbi:MAG TPA: hypothetical protein VGJ85_00270 [Candidatus Nanopelagicaceae bacterium]|jgi:hypothetical protein